MNKYKELLVETKKLSSKDISENLEKIIDKLGIEISDVEEYYNSIVNDEIMNFYENLFEKFSNSFSLNSDFVTSINKSKTIKALQDDEDEHSLIDPGSLNSSVEGVCDNDYIPSIKKYAVSWFRIVKNHCFSNGNKRTGYIATKSAFLIDMMDVLFGNNFDIFHKEQKNSEKANIKNIKKINGCTTKIAKKIAKENDKIFSNFLKRNNEKFLKNEFDEITKAWDNDASNDYVLTIFIVLKINSENSSQDEIDRIYNILVKNLISFFTMNDEILAIRFKEYFDLEFNKFLKNNLN